MTSDPDVAALAREVAGAQVIPDHDPPRGMNGAVERGLGWVEARGADAALVLTADLPLARPEDVAAIMAAAQPAPSAVLVPSHDGTGTNAMLLRPPRRDRAAPGTRLARAPPGPGRPPRGGRPAARAPPPGARHRHPARPGGADRPRRRLRHAGGLRPPGGGRAARRRERALRLWPLSALPEVRPGDDLAAMLAERAGGEGVAPGDVVVVAHKVVSKAEGRIVALAAVRPGPAARRPGRRDRQGGGPLRADPLREPAGGAPPRGHGHLRDPPRLRLRQRRRRLLERARGGGGAAAGRPRRLGAPPPGADRGGGGGEGGAGGDRHPRARLPPRPGQRGDRGRRLRAGGRPPRRARPRGPGAGGDRPGHRRRAGRRRRDPHGQGRRHPRGGRLGGRHPPGPGGAGALVRDPAQDLFRT